VEPIGILNLRSFSRPIGLVWNWSTIANPNIALFSRQDFGFEDGFPSLGRPYWIGAFPPFNLVFRDRYLRVCIGRKVIRVPNMYQNLKTSQR
jgi:hypothetical protein